MLKIHHIQRFHEPHDDAAAGAEGADAKGGLGSAFQKMVRDIKGEPEAAADEQPAAEPEKKPEKKAEKSKRPAGAAVPDDALKAPEKPAEKPIEEKKPQGADVDTETKGFSDAAKSNWKTLRGTYESRIAAAEAKAADFEKQAREASKQIVPPEQLAEITRIKEEHKELLATVERLGLERSPKFNAEFVAGHKALVDQVAKKVVEGGGDADAFREALKLTGRAKYAAIEESIGEVPSYLQSQISASIVEIERLEERRDSTLANSRKSLEQWESEERERAREQSMKRQTEQKEQFAMVTSELGKDFMLLREIPNDSAGAKDWNEARAGIVERANNFLFTATSFQDFATAAIAAEQAPILQGMFLAERELRVALERELSELGGADPGIGAHNGGGGRSPASGEDNGGGLAGRFNAAMDTQE